MSKKLTLILTIFALSLNSSFADEIAKPEEPKKEEKIEVVATPVPTATIIPAPPKDEIVENRWSFIGHLGINLGASTNTVKDSSGTVLSTDRGLDRSAISYAGEIGYRVSNVFTLGLEGRSSAYRYSTDAANDSHLSISVVPKLTGRFKKVVFWGGVGVGVMFTKFGTTSETANGSTVTIDEKVTSLAFSPRIGLDWFINPTVFIGPQITYFTTNLDVNAKVTGKVTKDLKGTIERQWVDVAVRLGVTF